VAGIAWDAVLCARIAQGQFAAAAAAANEPGEQRVTMLGCSVMSAGWNVLAHHSADRLRALPIHVALMGPGLQRQPFGALLAAAMHATRTTMARRNAGLTATTFR
jgi:hypothetical protein